MSGRLLDPIASSDAPVREDAPDLPGRGAFAGEPGANAPWSRIGGLGASHHADAGGRRAVFYRYFTD